MKRGIPACLIIGALLLVGGCAVLDAHQAGIPGSQGQDERTILAGLREALIVGVQRTAQRTARENGYLGNAVIRIPLPREFQRAAAGLRAAGLGSQADQLEVAMNRAAESAAGEAIDVFRQVIVNMRPADVLEVLRGNDDAATLYLRRSAEPVLRARYQPIIERQLREVQAAEIYGSIATRWNRLPLVEPLTLDLDDYVTGLALDGLFVILAEEERRIRTDPAARTSQLLRDVFGFD